MGSNPSNVTVQYEVTIKPAQEHIVVETGNPEVDKHAAEEIASRVRQGDTWAWAEAMVTAKVAGFAGFASVAPVSCTNEADFRKSKEFRSLKVQAGHDLAQAMSDARGQGELADNLVGRVREIVAELETEDGLADGSD